MRTNEEQVQEILKRAGHMRAVHDLRVKIGSWSAASLLCVALLIALVAAAPGLNLQNSSAAEGQYGSLLLAQPYILYVVVGLLSFALGVCVTVLCVQWRKLKREETGTL